MLTKNWFLYLISEWQTGWVKKENCKSSPRHTHTHKHTHTAPKIFSRHCYFFSFFSLTLLVVVAGTHFGKFPKPKLRNGFGVFFHNSGCHSPEPDIPILCLIKNGKSMLRNVRIALLCTASFFVDAMQRRKDATMLVIIWEKIVWSAGWFGNGVQFTILVVFSFAKHGNLGSW